MNAQDLEHRARELLAAEWEAMGDQSIAIKLRRGDAGMDYSFVAAIHAIVAALRKQPAPADVSEVTRQLIERDSRGRAKYGTSLDRTDLTLPDWLQHMAEELLDAAGYALAAKRTSQQQPAPVDLEDFREAVQAMDAFIFHRERCGIPHQICDCGMKDARDRLLSIIDNAGKVECAQGAGTGSRRERLLERRNILNNSFGSSAFGDGLLQKQIDAIDAELATLPPSHQPAPVVDDAVQELIQKWRKLAEQHGVRTFTGNDHALFANELEAALARAQGVAR